MTYDSLSKKIGVFWMYYKKVCYPTLVLTLFIGLIGSGAIQFSLSRFAQSYFVIAPAIHFVQYGIRYSHEQHFYYHLGFHLRKLLILSFTANCAVTFGTLFLQMLWN